MWIDVINPICWFSKRGKGLSLPLKIFYAEIRKKISFEEVF